MKYDYSKVSRAALERMAQYQCERVGGLDDCKITNAVRDEARVKSKRELATELINLLGCSAHGKQGSGIVTFNVIPGDEPRILDVLIAYTRAE